MILDISSKINVNEHSTLKITDDKEYVVNDGAEVMLKAEQLFKKAGTLKDYYSIIEMFLGKEALDDIKSMDLSIGKLSKIIIGIMALVNEVDYEEMESRFQKQIDK